MNYLPPPFPPHFLLFPPTQLEQQLQLGATQFSTRHRFLRFLLRLQQKMRRQTRKNREEDVPKRRNRTKMSKLLLPVLFEKMDFNRRFCNLHALRLKTLGTTGVVQAETAALVETVETVAAAVFLRHLRRRNKQKRSRGQPLVALMKIVRELLIRHLIRHFRKLFPPPTPTNPANPCIIHLRQRSWRRLPGCLEGICPCWWREWQTPVVP